MYMYIVFNYIFMPCHSWKSDNAFHNIPSFKIKADYFCEKVNIFIFWERDFLHALCLTQMVLVLNLTFQSCILITKVASCIKWGEYVIRKG